MYHRSLGRDARVPRMIVHAKARELRARGHTYNEIAAELGVSKSSVSLWVRDMPRPGRVSYDECRQRNAEGVAKYWETESATS